MGELLYNLLVAAGIVSVTFFLLTIGPIVIMLIIGFIRMILGKE